MSSRLTLKELRAFAAVHHAGQVWEAADRLSLTPSAVSVLLRQIEVKLGVSLFDRTTRSLRRTDAAEELIGTVDHVLKEIDLLPGRVKDLEDKRRGRVRVAVTPTVAQSLLPFALRSFSDKFPGVDVSVDDCSPSEFLSRVSSRQVDVGIGTPDQCPPELLTRTIVRDQLSIVCARGMPLSHHRAISWRDLHGQAVITVKHGFGIRSAIDATTARLGIELRYKYEVSLLSTALALAAQGLAAAILPASMARGSTGLVCRKLIRPVVDRRICVITRRDVKPSAASQAFVQVLEGTATRIFADEVIIGSAATAADSEART